MRNAGLQAFSGGQKRIYVTNMASCPTNINNVNKEIVYSTTNRASENEPALIPRKSYSLKFAPGTVGLFQPSGRSGRERAPEIEPKRTINFFFSHVKKS